MFPFLYHHIKLLTLLSIQLATYAAYEWIGEIEQGCIFAVHDVAFIPKGEEEGQIQEQHRERPKHRWQTWRHVRSESRQDDDGQ